ncbi:MAG: helix-turn-helix transcriptional regulator [Clostridia bacterium]|nr:helix-turn-helix transcriptional regulator [Clostridia bacterium]
MTISYNKLWKLLIDKKLSKVALRKNADIAPNTMTKLRRDEPVSMLILLKIAEYLECDISDMCEFVKEEK